MAKDEVDRIFALVDVDNSGEIDFSEFVTATDLGLCHCQHPACLNSVRPWLALSEQILSGAGSRIVRFTKPLASVRRGTCVVKIKVNRHL